MKKLTLFLIISVLFISVLSFGDNEAHAEKFKWGKVTIDDEKAYGKVKIKNNVPSYKIKNKKMVKNKTKLKKGKEYAVYSDGVITQSNGDKNIDTFKIGENLYTDNKNVKYYPLDRNTRSKLVGNGTLQGTVTWEHRFKGTKPDIRARIVAFPKWRFNKISSKDFEYGAVFSQQAKNKGFYSTLADDYGNYTLTLPTGEYYILIKSNNTIRNYKATVDELIIETVNVNINNTFDENSYAIGLANVYAQEIEIAKGEIINISKDWERNYTEW